MSQSYLRFKGIPFPGVSVRTYRYNRRREVKKGNVLLHALGGRSHQGPPVSVGGRQCAEAAQWEKDIFEKIADEMQSLGIDCTGYQCENKMYKLITLHNKV